MKKKPLVSICCTTYNQEKYIKQTLDSFLMQKTNFEFEIVVHDDASTDNTAKIIKEYEDKYPNIIKTIYQKENQYSKNVKILPIIFGKVSGKYIAICEGDDYWCDEYKLQKQYDFMEKHENCSLITTGAKLLEDSTGKLSIKKQPYKGSRYYSMEEIIIGDGGLFATNSMFFRTDLVRKLPEIYNVAPVGDFPLTIHLAQMGKVYYLNDITSVYRTNAIGSWTNDMKKDAERKRNALLEGLKVMFDVFNKDTNNKYKDSVDYFLLKKELENAIVLGQYDKLKNPKFKKLYKRGNIKSRVKHFIKIKLTPIYKRIKNR